MRHCYLLLLGWLGTARLATAQTVVTGVVRDTTGQAVPGALLEARPLRDQQGQAAVAVAGADGSFALRVPFVADSLLLSARALGFAEQELRIRNQSRQADFRLRPSAAQLREVVVKAAPLTKQGDTLSYHVAAFTDRQDRVIADVLKKLPGVEVEADGRILFEGQPIQKFYINGADLLEGRYNLASNNLPAASVQQVQVLQRHQPVRALARVQPSEQASLNLQLKKQVTVTGQARVGAGGAPFRWNANLAPILFAPGHQLLDTYQTNNSGYDAATELRPLGLEELRQLGELPNRPVALTGIQRLDAPPLATSRYLFNQVHLLAANHLLTLGKQSQLRVNASYLHDAQRQSGQTRTLYYLPGEAPVELREDKQNQLYFNSLQADLALIRNLPRYYVKNTLSIRGTHDAQRGYLLRGAQPAVDQRATTPSYGLSNRLGVVRPLGSRLLLQFTSLLSYATDPQQLAVQPGPFAALLRPGSLPYDEAHQRARLSGTTALHSLTLLTQRGRWSYSLAAGLRQEWQQLTSTLTSLPPRRRPYRCATT